VSAVDDILSQIPLGQLADQLGVDQGTAEQAARQALPALLGGMEANAQDPAGAQSLAGALGAHSPALVEGGVNLDEVDTDDGDKIVGHVFGDNRGEVVNRLGATGSGGGGQDLIGKLLPILAPIVLSYLAGRLGGGGGKTSAVSAGGLGDILGGLLGGGGKGGGGGIGDLLGGLLGGGRR
jgi:hypothetical protein